MKKILVLVAIVLGLYSLQAQDRKLVWADEFDGNELNQDHWSLIVGDGCPQLCGWGNDELQVYNDQNHRIENGMLYIKAEREGEHYTSTRINTKGKKAFQYGRFEVRAKLPVGEPINEEAWHWYDTHIGHNETPIVDTWWQTETGGILISSLAGVTPQKPTYATLPMPGIQAALVDNEGKVIIENEAEGILTINYP